MLRWFFRNVIGKIAAAPVRRQLAAFEAATLDPQRHQRELLQRFLAFHRDTEFGRDHHFGSIQTIEDFRRNVPISTYDYFEPYLAKVRRGDFQALLADSTIHMFALTSGTTATRKTIPVTAQYLRDYRRGWNMWGLKVFRDHPGVKLRPIVQLSGDWQEFKTEAGIPCGAVTGLTATMQKRIIRWLYCVPAIVGKVKDAATKYYLALRLSIPRRVGMIIAANPSTLVNLARFGDEHRDLLIRDIAEGTLSGQFDVPGEVREAIAGRIRRRRPERAKELEAIVERTGHLYPKDYWAGDCIIGNWTGGSVGCYLRQFPTYYGNIPVRDVGLIASEGRMTIPVEDATPSGILDITSHFFEFIPEAEVESSNPTVLQPHEVEEGQNYYILPTTAYGLYRYHIYDVVRVTGFYNQTPLVAFLSKGSLFSNLTGEKLSEYHVTGAMQRVLQQLDVTLAAYTLAPCWDEQQPYYALFIEENDLPNEEAAIALAECLDEELQRCNIEYAAKRQSLRLGPIRVAFLRPGTWEDWDRKRLQKTGGAMEQYKRPCLISDPQFRESMPVVKEIAPGELKARR